MELIAILNAIAVTAPTAVTDIGALWHVLNLHASGVPVTADQIAAAQAITHAKRKLIADDIAAG